MMTLTATPAGDAPRYHAVPAFPGAFGDIDTAGIEPDQRPAYQLRLVANRLDTVRKAYAKHTKWLEACALYSAGAADAPNVRSMPSKDAKHRLYDACGDLVRACGWGSGGEVRCHTLDDIAVLIATVESLLRGR